MSHVVCCEHNPCPDRPRFFLFKFRNRPWRCDQCGSMWVTASMSSEGGTAWWWEKVASDD